MSIAKHICASLELPAMIVEQYLDDLSDTDLLVRPLESMNHIAWQLGHLIRGENFHISQIDPEAMPTLPADFDKRHTDETASSDDPADFLTKAQYLQEMATQRKATLALLGSLGDEDLMREAPESIRYFGLTIGSVFSGEATHWMMHAGQWAVVRRKLGRAPLF